MAMTDRVFSAADAQGGQPIDPSSTAVVLIEYQNEFCAQGGKLHDAVKGVMAANNMLQNSIQLVNAARAKGCKIMHTPITFAPDGSDNPNKGLGILKGCYDNSFFTRGTWNADFVAGMEPKEGDMVIQGKRGLDAFPGTDLEEQLKRNHIQTVVLGGLLTNCCVESTMRTAFEKGYNVVTLTDCTAATSLAGHAAAAGPEGTWGMFSTRMTKDEFVDALHAQPRAPEGARGQESAADVGQESAADVLARMQRMF